MSNGTLILAISDTGVLQNASFRQNLSVKATVIGLAALAAALHVYTPFNHDEAFYIEGAGRLLGGIDAAQETPDDRIKRSVPP